MTSKDECCPHCGMAMVKWVPNPDSAWGPEFQFVCFNDECSYYVKGWDWMWSQFAQRVSYRFRYNPRTGEKGPLPVHSPNAFRSGILDDSDEESS